MAKSNGIFERTMSSPTRRKQKFLLFLIVSLWPCRGLLASQSSGWEYSLGGSFKSIFSMDRLRQTGIFQQDTIYANEERLRPQGSLSRGWFRIEFADELSFVKQTGDPSVIPVPNFTPQTALNTSWSIVSNSTESLTNTLDRAFVQLTFNQVQFILGKQVIPMGVGKIFTAVSQVPRYPLTKIDPEYEFTEDAATMIWQGPFTLEARFLPKVPGQQKENFHLRAKGSKGQFDMALTTGISDDKAFAGFEATGNVGDSVLRGEIVGYQENNQGWVQGLAGFDRAFTSKLSCQFEVFYNGFGQKSGYQLVPFLNRPLVYRGLWYAGLTASYDISARLKANLLTIADLDDPSFFGNLSFVFSWMSNVDLVLGQFLSVAGNQNGNAEFGGQLPIPNLPGLALGVPDITYFELRWYF